MPTTTIFIFCAVLLATISSRSPPAVVATTIIGAGGSNLQPLWDAWSRDYKFSKDSIDIQYSSKRTDLALQSYINGEIDFCSTDIAFSEDEKMAVGNIIQLPLVATAMSFAYRLDTLDPAEDSLVLDRPTLARIWAGSIVTWDDPAIAMLNKDLHAKGKLPHLNITFIYYPGVTVGQGEVVKNALSSFSDEFRAAIAAAGNLFERLPPFLEGRATTGLNVTARLDWVKENNGAMSYFNIGVAQQYNLTVIKMINKAGKLVEPNAEATLCAMNDFREEIHQGRLALNLTDAPGPHSWPVCYMSYLTINASATSRDCTIPSELLLFLSWAILNDQTNDASNKLGYIGLSNAIRRRVMDTISALTCNDEKVFNVNVLMGIGPPLSVFSSWTQGFESSGVKMKYFHVSSEVALQEMAAADSDFGVVDVEELTPQQLTTMPDVVLLPLMSAYVVPTYNIPELTGGLPLILNLHIVADILLNKITTWNDPRIISLNPAFERTLPNKSIIVVYPNQPTSLTGVLGRALSFIYEFNEKVNVGGAATFPVLSDPSRGIKSATVLKTMEATNYSFGFGTLFEILKQQTIRIASLDISDTPSYRASNSSSIISPGDPTWPLILTTSILVRSRTMPECNKARSLLDWIYWTQVSPAAIAIAKRQGVKIASDSDSVRMFNFLANVTCNDKPVFCLYTCVYNGTLCSGKGSCLKGKCVCDEGSGQYCEIPATSGGNTLQITLGVLVPLISICIVVLVCVIMAQAFFVKRWRRKNAWEIDYSELEIGRLLGTGGYGKVHQAMWKGTEVAVKTLTSKEITTQMRKSFLEEVRVMITLRHPNIVLFMGACTRPPHLCIVMEYMTLGSLYELLHNRLIPEFPYALIVRMANQTANGMHFLHSSGIVHRDLKSLNLLLDPKWNVKVSDFGLTKFRDEMKKNRPKKIQGSLFWTAPEVLLNEAEIDYTASDVYSFGVILWELLTREEPYAGISMAAVAVSVIRDDYRPEIREHVNVPKEYIDLLKNCWHRDPTVRPSFCQIMTILGSWMRESKRKSSPRSSNDDLKSLMDSSSSSQSRLSSSIYHMFRPEGRREATALYDQATPGMGSFCMVFPTAENAIGWCEEVQNELLKLPWPYTLLEHFAAKEQIEEKERAHTTTKGKVLFKGIRIRMGVHSIPSGVLAVDPLTRRLGYKWEDVELVACIAALAHGGQVLVSRKVVKAMEHYRFTQLGEFELTTASCDRVELFELRIQGLEERFFHTVDTQIAMRGTEAYQNEKEDEAKASFALAFPNANQCKWIVSFEDILLGPQIGTGSFGIVYKGTWKGVEVAVKRFIRQRFDEATMLQFRAETGLMSALQHANVAMLVGSCVRRPNVCLVSEFVGRGTNLKKILANHSLKLKWKRKLKVLRGVAKGMAYLHSERVLHRNLKPSNVLVEQNWNVKVTDFGFARIKEAHATMTKSVSPRWTAPEVIRGESHSEASDVYSFGIIIWEVLTRSTAFDGMDYICISMEVLKGSRPLIPSSMPPEIQKLLKKCWHDSPAKRPSMTQVQSILECILSGSTQDHQELNGESIV